MSIRDLLSPEQRAKLDAERARELTERAKLSAMSDEELAAYAENHLKNCFGLRRIASEYRGDPVYDSTMFYIVMPVLIERLRSRCTEQ